MQSMRGGILGGEGVIGEDGGIEKDSEEESSVDGMRTRQQRSRYRKKMSQDKADVLARTRQGTNNAKNGDPASTPADTAQSAQLASKKIVKAVPNKGANKKQPNSAAA